MASGRLFSDPESISKHLHCSICTEVFDQPHRLGCGHVFCKACIISWSEQKANCPQCRQKFNPKKLTRDMLASNLVEELKVKCGNKGCCWVGPLMELQQHLDLCLFHPGRESDWVLPMVTNASNQPSLFAKLYERNPDSMKAFCTRNAPTEKSSFFDFSDEDEENVLKP